VRRGHNLSLFPLPLLRSHYPRHSLPSGQPAPTSEAGRGISPACLCLYAMISCYSGRGARQTRILVAPWILVQKQESCFDIFALKKTRSRQPSAAESTPQTTPKPWQNLSASFPARTCPAHSSRFSSSLLPMEDTSEAAGGQSCQAGRAGC